MTNTTKTSALLAAALLLPGLAITSGAAAAPVAANTSVDAAASSGGGAALTMVDQKRILDTRDGAGAGTPGYTEQGMLDPAAGGIALDVVSELKALTGDDSIEPAAVVVNMTVTEAIGDGYVTTWGAGERPTASTVNFAAGENVANGATVPVDAATGEIRAYASAQTHLIVDIMGYYDAATGFVAITPTRVADSREGAGFEAMLTGGQEYSLDVAGGLEGVEAANEAYAVLVNLTTVGAPGAGYLTVWPGGEARPESSNVNYTDGAPIANNAMVKLGADGSIGAYSMTDTHVIVDVIGVLVGDPDSGDDSTDEPTADPTSDPTSGTDDGDKKKRRGKPVHAGKPERLFDARQHIGNTKNRQMRTIKVAGRGSLPKDVDMVYVNLTVVNAKSAGFATVGAELSDPPSTSHVNYEVGDIVSNMVPTKVTEDGTISVYTHGEAHIVLDIFGHQPGDAAEPTGDPTGEPTGDSTEEPTADPTEGTQPTQDPTEDSTGM